MKKYRLPLTCALVVLLSLALPFAVFSLWDKALLSAPHSQTAAQGLSAEARARFDCLHAVRLQPCTERPAGLTTAAANPPGRRPPSMTPRWTVLAVPCAPFTMPGC